jgi:hypothetical protein
VINDGVAGVVYTYDLTVMTDVDGTVDGTD